MEYRLMSITDISKLLTLWKTSGLKLSEDVQEMKKAEMMLELNQTSCFVAIDGNQIVGSIFGTFNGKRGWLYRLAVHPDHQKKGIGSKLYKMTEDALIKRGVTNIYIEVVKTNTCTPFYHKRGFKLMEAVYMYGKEIK